MSFFHPIYLPNHICFCPSLFRSFVQSNCPTTFVSVHLYFVLSSNLFAQPHLFLSIFISFFRPIYLPNHICFCPSLCRSFIQSICPTTFVSVHLYFVLLSNLIAQPHLFLSIFISFFRPIYFPTNNCFCPYLFRSLVQSIFQITIVSVHLYVVLSFFHPIYLPNHIYFCLSLFRSFVQSICPTTFVSVHLYVVLSSNLFAQPHLFLSIFISFFRPI